MHNSGLDAEPIDCMIVQSKWLLYATNQQSWHGPAGSTKMNANAQQYNETLRNWNQQWTDAALNAVKAHEQFVTNMVGAFNKPAGLENMQPQAREAAEKCIDYTNRQTLEGEKFVANMMRDGIEHTREFFKAQPELAWPMDAEKTRQSTDKFMQESAKTTADMINREMAFMNERVNDAAEFGRSMMNNAAAMATSAANGETPADGKNRVRVKA